MPYVVTHHSDAAAVLDEAGAFLATRPTRHNIVLTLLHSRATSAEPGNYWVVRDDSATDDEAVVGVVFQSPAVFPAMVTPMPPEAARAAVEAMVTGGFDLPGVNGEAPTSSVFAAHWAERRRVGARPVLAMRLHELGTLTQPVGVAGQARPAVADDVAVVRQWMQAFADFTEEPAMSDEVVAQLIGSGTFDLWLVDDRPVCVVGHTQPVHDVVRIGPVYTPEAERRTGYASALTAAVSKLIQAQGHTAVLYTDLGNPTSNSVYRSLGFAAIAEAVRYAFDDPSTKA
jgi:ribosomal protein S18 acetylase RimI-like enzyme